MTALQPKGRWEGFEQRECGEHRTLGGRAWCFDCREYCAPGTPCLGCEVTRLRAGLERIAEMGDPTVLAQQGQRIAREALGRG